MPAAQRLMQVRKITGPIWEWGKPFIITEKPLFVPVNVVASVFPQIFLDTPMGAGATDNPLFDPVGVADTTNIYLDTPIVGSPTTDAPSLTPVNVTASAAVVLI